MSHKKKQVVFRPSEAKAVKADAANGVNKGWTEVSPSNREGMRFFKVKVEMK